MIYTKNLFLKTRNNYIPQLINIFKNGANLKIKTKKHINYSNKTQINNFFPYSCKLNTILLDKNYIKKIKINVGIIFSGGPAPGGHNVIYGLLNGIKSLNKNNKIYGFLNGADGIIKNKYIIINKKLIKKYINTGGFNIIGTGRIKLYQIKQFDIIAKNCNLLKINAILIIGGDDSNTNACILSEYFLNKKIPISIIGCPKTIDNDIKNQYIETTFGFNTACKVYSNLISNIQQDTISSKKHWHFIKLMGRSASHITLECALQTHPNITLISEEIIHNKYNLENIVTYIASIITKRANLKLTYGTILIPEGLIETMPEIKLLITEINNKKNIINLIQDDKTKNEYIYNKILSKSSKKIYHTFPYEIQKQLISEIDPHGNIQISKISIEYLLIYLVKKHLNISMNNKKLYDNFIGHSFGYEGRSAFPTNFDATYCYNLGYTAAALINSQKTGYITYIKNLTKDINHWKPGGLPIVSMMHIDEKNYKTVVIKKTLIDITNISYKKFIEKRNKWKFEDDYIYVPPIQYTNSKIWHNDLSITLLQKY